MCGVKGAIHEQLAGVKSGEGCEYIYVFVSVKVCLCGVQTCLSVCTHMSVRELLYLTLMWSQQSECLTFTRDQIALEEDHLVVSS